MVGDAALRPESHFATQHKSTQIYHVGKMCQSVSIKPSNECRRSKATLSWTTESNETAESPKDLKGNPGL